MVYLSFVKNKKMRQIYLVYLTALTICLTTATGMLYEPHAAYPHLNFINNNRALSVRQPYYINAKNYVPYIFTRKDIPLHTRVTGQIRSDSIFSSRPYQTANVSELFALWPVQNISTITGGAGYAQQTFSVSNIFALLGFYTTIKLSEHTALRAFINGEFSGIFTENGVYRIHFSYIEAHHKNTEILVGQYANPMTIYENLPHVVSLTYGAPFLPYAVNPQILITTKRKHFLLQGCLYSQYTFFDNGPRSGISNANTGFSQQYQMNGIAPIINGKIGYEADDVECGLSINIKRIVPELFKPNLLDLNFDYQVKESITSLIGMMYLFYRGESICAKAQVYHGSNGTDLIMLGGYGRLAIPETSTRTGFTQLPFTSAWCEIEKRTPTYGIQPGIFIGICQQKKSARPLNMQRKQVAIENNNPVYFYYPEVFDLQHVEITKLLQKSIKRMLNISPRAWIYIANGAQIGLEILYTQALYGYLDCYADAIMQQESVHAVRTLASIQYFF